MLHIFQNSNNLFLAEYTEENNKLIIIFKNKLNIIYHYENVPLAVFDELRVSDSAGKYFRGNIMNKYLFTTSDIK